MALLSLYSGCEHKLIFLLCTYLRRLSFLPAIFKFWWIDSLYTVVSIIHIIKRQNLNNYIAKL